MSKYPTPEELLSDLPADRALSPLQMMKNWPDGNYHVEMLREKQSRSLTPIDDDSRLAQAFSKPAGKETLLAHLMKATISMPIKGTNKDSPDKGAMQTAMILNDMVEHLLDAKVTEVDLFVALYQLAETEEFFPSYSKLKKRL